MKDFLLVIPAYREHLRLPPFFEELIQILSKTSFSTAVQVVDDGSPLPEQEAMKEIVQEREVGACTILSPLFLSQNQGKGGAILAGWRHGPETTWKAFVDADGAVPAHEVRRLLEQIQNENNPQLTLIGSRNLCGKQTVKRSWFRHLLGRIFSAIVSLMTDIRIKDSQCGIKILPTTAFKKMDSQLKETSFAFDVELLVALQSQNIEIRETPIDWTEQPGGKLSVLKDGLKMLIQLIRLRHEFRAVTK